MSWPVKTHYIPWKSKPTKLYPLLKRESFHPCLAIRCFDWTSRATKKKHWFFSHPFEKICWINIRSCFFQIIVVENSKKKKSSKKQTPPVFSGGFSFFTCWPLFDKFDPHLSGESLSSTPMEDFTPKGLSSPRCQTFPGHSSSFWDE